jgi:hypothetical protein
MKESLILIIREVSMSDKNTVGTNVKGIDKDLHNAIKVEAIARNITVNDLYLKVVQSGAKRLKIVN